jgi:four helix bundle protein
MQDFKNLKVWQKAHELALYTYKITTEFPREELFGLRNTLRKTSVDIPALIAEGCAKENNFEFSRLIANSIAFGNRLEYYALMARDLGMIPEAVHSDYLERIVEVRKMLSGFSRRLEHGTP